LRALHRLGHEVVFYEKDVPYYAKRRDFTSVPYCRLMLYNGWEEARHSALNDARYSDVVINSSDCPNGINICDEILALERPLHVFYDLDTPITLAQLSNEEFEYLRPDQVAQFDLYLSWCGGEILDQLESRWGARKALPLYGCVDPEVHTRVPVPEPYRCSLSYMGTYAADRQLKFQELFLEPVRRLPDKTFVLAGSMYPQDLAWPSNLRRYEHVSPHDHPALYSGSRCTLNLTRDEMARAGYCPSGRLFEAASCGTPILSDWFRGLHQFFVPGEEILVARETVDVVKALSLPDEELGRLARRARQRTLDEHTGDQRAGQLIRYLESARNNHRLSSAEVA